MRCPTVASCTNHSPGGFGQFPHFGFPYFCQLCGSTEDSRTYVTQGGFGQFPDDLDFRISANCVVRQWIQEHTSVPEVLGQFPHDLDFRISANCVVRQWIQEHTSLPEVLGNFQMIWISVFLPIAWFDSGFKNTRQSRRFWGSFYKIWISVFLPIPWFDSGFKYIRQSWRFRTNTICL